MKETRTALLNDILFTLVYEENKLINMTLNHDGYPTALMTSQDVTDLVTWLTTNLLLSNKTTQTSPVVNQEPPKKSPYVNSKDQTVIPGMIDRSKELKGNEVIKVGLVSSSSTGSIQTPIEDRKIK
jgi:hypothetical protein